VDKINHSWVDPKQFKKDEDFMRAYNVAWAFAEASQQILQFVDNMIEEAESLTKKERGELKNKWKEMLRI
jgi:hypothetical protein